MPIVGWGRLSANFRLSGAQADCLLVSKDSARQCSSLQLVFGHHTLFNVATSVRCCMLFPPRIHAPDDILGICKPAYFTGELAGGGSVGVSDM